MIIRHLVVGPIQTNCYILGDEMTGMAAVIDPGGDVEMILDTARQDDFHIAYVINTHGHFDHIAGNAELIAATGAKLAAHPADVPLFQNSGGAHLFGILGVQSPLPDILLDEGDTLEFGESTLIVLHTPGHTPGSISLYNEEAGVVFCGDCLFHSGIGRTDLPGGDYDTLMASLEKLLALPHETVVYSGHGPATTVGQEKDTNPFLI